MGKETDKEKKTQEEKWELLKIKKNREGGEMGGVATDKQGKRE